MEVFRDLKNKINDNDIINKMNKYSLLLQFILACMICLFIEIVSRHSIIDGFAFAFRSPLTFLYNAAIIFVTLLLVYLVRRRTFARCLLTTLWCVLGIANGCVLANRVTPFNFTDLKLIGDLFTMLDSYFSIYQQIGLLIAVIIGIAILIFIMIKAPVYEGKTHRVVMIFIIIATSFVYQGVTNAAVSSNILTDYFENIAEGYKKYGFVYGFTSSVLGTGMGEPESYSETSIKNIEDSVNIENTTVKEDDEPNIIVVLLESFVDPTEIKYLNLSKDPIPTFRKLEKNYTSGYLTVPVVGAGTANTEFEILTGMSMKYFGVGEYPYKTVLKTTSCESIASDLSSIGYGTHVVHNNGGNFYSRTNAFSMMGFDTFTSKELMNIQSYTPTGSWATDDILVGEVTKALDSTKDKSDFVYTITVQAHGAYPTEKVIQNPYVKVSGAETEGDNNQWEYYVNEIHEVDNFIKNLIEEVSKRDEKTEIVFFGDHYPTMNNLSDEEVKSGSIFKTKYITWNNFGAEKNDEDITSYQLLAKITGELGIHEGTIFRYHQNAEITGNTSESDSYLSGLELLQYDLLYGKKYAYNGEELYPASNLIMGVSEVKITKVDNTINDQIAIFGLNFTPWSRVYINGEKVSTTYASSNKLLIDSSLINDGDEIVVNQVGSKDTIFRSSNTFKYVAPKISDITPDNGDKEE
ncbi:Phosphoglycerol transferase MdoB [Acetitomaculum ruminis DSM 5522]|uniref:Phosphoglycerol transferase MdoB n=1 Tax=Acetitomaculum ruminis DSM 5522 TaxID=1120918 RepID=A0A1I0V7T3_9FIRM|nr:LTA synthase family protein [Acetitomaculum ruminis]SFA72419.1 Phosphoglycerol transferase MdoB [Acetitomaculum ruminis DSM 5522]